MRTAVLKVTSRGNRGAPVNAERLKVEPPARSQRELEDEPGQSMELGNRARLTLSAMMHQRRGRQKIFILVAEYNKADF